MEHMKDRQKKYKRSPEKKWDGMDHIMTNDDRIILQSKTNAGRGCLQTKLGALCDQRPCFAYLFLNMAIMRQSGTDKKDNGWMTCDLTSFSTVFQSYQDDKRTIMKGCVHWNSVYD